MKTLMLFLQNTLLSTLIGMILGVCIKVAADEKRVSKTVEQKKVKKEKEQPKGIIGFAITEEVT
ncbi:MAG: hypothetical protein J6U54_03505 [Clostridiales bacterium]|nr:hypothetical protein [Clostridiales bacterium]